MNESPHTDQSGLGRGMLWLAALGMLAGLTFLFYVTDSGPRGAVRQLERPGQDGVVLSRARNGHFLAQGSINDQSVTFLVDTGATDVALSEDLARRLGLNFGPRVTVMTAGGPARAWVTRLDKVTVGNLSLENVRASITPALGDEVLLGMSFLRHFELRQENEELIISYPGVTRT